MRMTSAKFSPDTLVDILKVRMQTTCRFTSRNADECAKEKG